MVEIIATDEFATWYGSLDENTTADVRRTVDLLEVAGVTLGFPYSSKLEGSRYNLRELRLTSQRHEIRIAYSFDPVRQAVLLLGGDKTGADERRFYERLIANAERIWEEYANEEGFEP